MKEWEALVIVSEGREQDEFDPERAKHELEREKFLAAKEDARVARELDQQRFDAEKAQKSSISRSRWLPPLLGFLGGVLGSLGAVYTGLLDVEVRDRAVDVQEMRIAFEMLQLRREQVGDTYRSWACNVLAIHSEAPLDCTADDAVNADFSQPITLSNLTVGAVDQGDPSLTDIGLFVCEPSDEVAARRAAATLRDSGFGDISLRRWNLFDELPRDVLSGRTTIVFDANHPERDELPRVSEALEASSLGDIREVANSGSLTRWYISVILCDLEG